MLLCDRQMMMWMEYVSPTKEPTTLNIFKRIVWVLFETRKHYKTKNHNS